MPSRSPNAPTTPLQAALLRHITARGLSQRGLAKASDVDHSQISRLLSGKSATADAPTLQRLADALQTTVDELLGRAPPPAPAGAVISGNGTSADPAALLLRLDEIADNPMNPRQTFDEIEDDRLAESIASVGVLQPLLVTAEESPDGRPLWRVDVGGRRLRALRALAARGRWNPEAHNVPARRSGPGDEKHARVVMLVENLQRLDLAPLDEAQAYRELRALDLSTADIAERVHRSQRHVQGRLAIAENLSAELQQRLAAGVLTVDQARALAGAPPHVQAAIERAIAAGGEAPGADAIERRIAGQTIPASRAAFALDDYTAAGGAILDDADSHERLCLDGRLFKRLQRRALLRLRDQLMVDNCAFVDVLSGPPADGAYADTKDEARAGAVLWLGRDLALGQRRGVRRVQPPDDLAARSPANAPANAPGRAPGDEQPAPRPDTPGGADNAPAAAAATPQADALRDEARAAVGAELAHGIAGSRYLGLRLLLLLLLGGEAPIAIERARAAPQHARHLVHAIAARRDAAGDGEARDAVAWRYVSSLTIEELLDGLAAGVADAFALGDDAASRELLGQADAGRRSRQRRGAGPVAGDHAAQQPVEPGPDVVDIPEFLRRR